MSTKFLKNGELIATADNPSSYSYKSDLPGVGRINLYYFKKIKLEPVIAFQHLAGTSLYSWLDGCSLELEEGDKTSTLTGLRYVYGRSEAMKGKHTVSVVLLADPEMLTDVPNSEWQGHLPEVYKSFLFMRND